MSNHLGDTNKMVSDTPRVDAATKAAIEHGTGDVWFLAMKLERELNAANERIQSLIEERDRANRLADWKWNLRGEFESLLGTDNIEKGIKAVKEMKQRIKRLEKFASRFLNPEDLGWAIGKFDRDEAREALGKERVESKSKEANP